MLHYLLFFKTTYLKICFSLTWYHKWILVWDSMHGNMHFQISLFTREFLYMIWQHGNILVTWKCFPTWHTEDGILYYLYPPSPHKMSHSYAHPPASWYWVYNKSANGQSALWYYQTENLCTDKIIDCLFYQHMDISHTQSQTQKVLYTATVPIN